MISVRGRPDRLFRSLAARRPLPLALGYILSIGTGAALYSFGRLKHLDLLVAVGALGGVAAASVLFTVVTWYQSEEAVRGGFFLGITSCVSKAIGLNVGVLIVAGGSGGNLLLATGSFFGLPICILLWSIIFGILISIGRRYRHLIGPEIG